MLMRSNELSKAYTKELFLLEDYYCKCYHKEGIF